MANYTYEKTFYDWVDYQIIETTASNITSKVINSALCSTSYYGINGGFFAFGSATIPPVPNSISWVKGTNNNCEKNLGNDASGKIIEVKRGTLAIFVENGIFKCLIESVKNVDEMKAIYPNTDFRVMIGGGYFDLFHTESYWKDTVFPSEKLSCQIDYYGIINPNRTGLGFKVVDNVWKIYLVVTTMGTTLTKLRSFLKDKLGCWDAMFLDGSGSSQLQCKNGTTLVQNKGSDPNRIISNMIALINT